MAVCDLPPAFSHVIDSEKKFDGMKELIESVILSLYSVGYQQKPTREREI